MPRSGRPSAANARRRAEMADARDDHRGGAIDLARLCNAADPGAGGDEPLLYRLEIADAVVY